MTRRILLSLLLLGLLLSAVLATPPVAECFGCTKEQINQCRDESEVVYNDCMNLYGAWATNYCWQQADEYEAGCRAAKGCPIPPYKP